MFATFLMGVCTALILLGGDATNIAQQVFVHIVSLPGSAQSTQSGFAVGTIMAISDNALVLREQSGHLVEVLSIDTTDIETSTTSSSGQHDTLQQLTAGVPIMVMGTPTGISVITALSIREVPQED